MKRHVLLYFPVFFFIALFFSCRQKEEVKKIFYINSYHEGYPSSDDIARGIQDVLKDEPVNLQTFYMDTKRNKDEAFIESQTAEVLDRINEFNPDILIASDDNAVRYVVLPHFKGKEMPVIFCGVNWSAEKYGLPADNVTGVLEVLPVEKGISYIREYYPEAGRITILSEYSNSEMKNIDFVIDIIRGMGLEADYLLAEHFEDWKSMYLSSQQSSDMLYLPTNGAIENWNHKEAVDFVKSNIRVPTLTCDDFMMPYVAFGVTKIQSEQGIKSAEMALDVLEGKPVNTIPVKVNKRTQIWYNPELASRINFKPDSTALEKMEIYRY